MGIFRQAGETGQRGKFGKMERRGNGANLRSWRDGATGQIWKAGENGKGNEREKRGKGKRGFEGGPREGEEGSKGRVREDLRKHQRKLNVVKFSHGWKI